MSDKLVGATHIKQAPADKIPAHNIIRYKCDVNLRDLFDGEGHAIGGEAKIHDNGDGTYDLYSFDDVDFIALHSDYTQTLNLNITDVNVIKGKTIKKLVDFDPNTGMPSFTLPSPNITKIDFGKYDMENLEDLTYAFYYMAYGPGDLESCNFGGLKLSKMTDLSWLYNFFFKIEELDLSGIDWSNKEYITQYPQAGPNTKLKRIIFGPSEMPKLKQISFLFNDMLALEYTDFFENRTLPVVTSAERLFDGFDFGAIDFDFSTFSSPKLTNFKKTFASCKNLDSFKFTDFTTLDDPITLNWTLQGSSIKNLDLSGIKLGSGYMGLRSSTNLETFTFDGVDTDNMTTAFEMFLGCSALTSLDIRNLNTSNITNFGMFASDCVSLTDFKFDGVDFSHVTKMNDFISKSPLTTIDMTSIDVSSCKDLSGFFWKCKNAETIDISTWNTPEVENIRGLFYQCEKLTDIDITSLSFGKVTNANDLFGGCSELTSIDTTPLGNLQNDCNIQAMFEYCGKLKCITRLNTTDTNHHNPYIFNNCDSLEQPSGSDFDDITSDAGSDWTNPNSCPA